MLAFHLQGVRCCTVEGSFKERLPNDKSMPDTRKYYLLEPTTATCDCFGEISVRRQGDLQVCLQLGRMQSDYARILMSPPFPIHMYQGTYRGPDANRGTGRSNVDFE